MGSPRRRFRIEGPGSPEATLREAGPVLPADTGLEARLGRMLGIPVPSRGGSPEGWAGLERLASELHAMRDAITTTKSEMADLQRSPAGADGMHRAAGELDAVSIAAERATTTILNAVEEIELSANLLRTGASEAGRQDAVDVILDRVLQLYEACNFQDIAGQRIRKVVTTLKFVEARLDRLIEAWDGEAARGRHADGVTLLAGPSLPGDQGHVSQSDVDAFFT